jgi:hypothetical protein
VNIEHIFSKEKCKQARIFLGRQLYLFCKKLCSLAGWQGGKGKEIPWWIRTTSREREDSSQNTFLTPSEVIIYIIYAVSRAKISQWFFSVFKTTVDYSVTLIRHMF